MQGHYDFCSAWLAGTWFCQWPLASEPAAACLAVDAENCKTAGMLRAEHERHQAAGTRKAKFPTCRSTLTSLKVVW